jgi:pimeloyl-ACP methyl ester carboxylesterase
MSKRSISNIAEVNGIRLHYMDYPGNGPVMLMAHSLSGNSLIFQGLIEAGLSPAYRVISPDFRGRGLSDKPTGGYDLENQSQDILQLLDQLGIEKVIVCGHSFGGLWGVHFAYHHPERVERLILLDVAQRLNPLTPWLVNMSTGRLLRTYPSWQHYEALMRHAPFVPKWDDTMIHFLRADAEILPDGTVKPRTAWLDSAKGGAAISSINDREWGHFFRHIEQPTLLVQARQPFVYGQYIVPEEEFVRTTAIMPRGSHIQVDGNHITMLFGEGARQIVDALTIVVPKSEVSRPTARPAAMAKELEPAE